MRFSAYSVSALLICLGAVATASELSDKGSPTEIAAEVDRLVESELKANDVEPAGLSVDEDFLRRVTLDLAGTLPSSRDVTLFGLNPDLAKREQAIERLLNSDEYAAAWARYWRDVIFGRATNMRAVLANQSFVDWMTDNLSENKGWDKIATEMLTATGDVRENGSTALIFAQEASPEDVAGEVSRIFWAFRCNVRTATTIHGIVGSVKSFTNWPPSSLVCPYDRSAKTTSFAATRLSQSIARSIHRTVFVI